MVDPNTVSNPTMDRLRRGQTLLAAFLPRLRIRTKLAVLLAFPLAALLFFALRLAQHRLDEARRVAKVQELSELARPTAALVHELQRERGASAGFVGSKGTTFGDALSSNRGRTDKAVEALRQFLAEFDEPRELKEPLGRVRREL